MTLLLDAVRAVAVPLRCALTGHGEPVGPTPVDGRQVWTCERCGAPMVSASVGSQRLVDLRELPSVRGQSAPPGEEEQ